MRYRRKLILIYVVFVSLLFASRLHSSDCIENLTEEWLEEISRADEKTDKGHLSYSIYCLYVRDLMNLQYHQDYMTSAEKLSQIYEENEPLKERVFELVLPFLDSPDHDIRCEAARALAYYRWPDSFMHLIKCDSVDAELALFIVLGDKRAVPWIIKRYNKYEITNGIRPPVTGHYSYERKQCIMALYHFASPEILPFIDEIIENSSDELLTEIADKVRDRIFELFPETRRENGQEEK